MPERGRGLLITLEGVEGAGKSSQAPLIARQLDDAGLKPLLTREPGGTTLAESVRDLLVNGDDMPAMAELLLMFAARSSHVQEAISPALSQGQWVVCDRFVDASFAYQGAGRGIDASFIQALCEQVVGDCMPDLVLVFDLPVETGMQRIQGRDTNNRFDRENAEFMQRVRECYLQRASANPSTHVVINASLDIDEVTAQVQRQIKRLLEQNAVV